MPRNIWLLIGLFMLLGLIVLAFQSGRIAERQRTEMRSATAVSPASATPLPPTRDPSLSQVAGLQAELQTVEASLATAVYRNEAFGAQAAFSNLQIAALQGTGTAVIQTLTHQAQHINDAQATIAAHEGTPLTPTPTIAPNLIATVLHKISPATPSN